MWAFKQNIYKTRREEGVVIICYEFTLSTTSASSESYTYTDCDGLPQIGNIGGVGGYDANTFCARTVDTFSGAITVTNNGVCSSISTTQEILLGYSGANSTTACTNIATPVLRYIPAVQDWMVVTFLYQNVEGTIPANPGFYSDGAKWYKWDGASFTSTGFC